MIGKGFYRKWVKSSFEQFITTQTRVGSTNGWIISQNAEILKFYFSTIFGICDVIKWLRLRGCALSLTWLPKENSALLLPHLWLSLEQVRRCQVSSLRRVYNVSSEESRIHLSPNIIIPSQICPFSVSQTSCHKAPARQWCTDTSNTNTSGS